MKLSPTAKQTIYSLGALLNMTNMGLVYGFPAFLIPALLDPTSDIHCDKHQAAWLASLPGVSGVIVVFAIGYLMHAFGRRVTNLSIAVPVFIGWILTYKSNSLPMLFISRFLHSFSCGGKFFYATCIGEFADPKIRSVLLTMKAIAVTLGVCLAHLFGTFLHWRHLALMATVPTALTLIITYFWPETPEWLVSRGRYDEAEIVFFALRGENEEGKRELAKLINDRINQQEVATTTNTRRIFQHLRSPVLWRPVLLLFSAIALTEIGGCHYFPLYSLELATKISNNNSRRFVYTLIKDGVSLISTVISFYFVKKFKIRKLLFFSGYIAVTILMTSSLLLYITSKYYENIVIIYITSALFVLYFFVLYSATFAVCYVLLGELLPLEYRATGVVINGVLSSMSVTAIVKLFQILKDIFEVHGMFFVFSVCMLLPLLYMQYDLPETKGRTLQDIGDYFRGKSPKIRNNERGDANGVETELI